jgi:cold shock CspA family protein
MLTGTVSDYDARERVGLIDSDDGRLLIFHSDAVIPAFRRDLHVGTRVRFEEEPTPVAPRAVQIAALPPRSQGAHRSH